MGNFIFSPDSSWSWLVIILAVWSLPWKGLALWKAARFSSKKWFVALLVLNTLAVLDILYIFVFSKKKTKTPVKQGE